MIELLVSMFLVSIVIVIVFFIYLTASKAYIRWQSESSFTDDARLIMSSLNNSLSNTIKIMDADNSSITILENDLRQTRYNVSSSGSLYKNEVPLSSAEYKLSDFTLNYATGKKDSLQIRSYDELDTDFDFKVSDEELSQVNGIEYSFTLKSTDESKLFDGLVMIRNY